MSDLNTARIFISYARDDGEDCAKHLRKKLVAEFGEEDIWRDREMMEGGQGWWKQITDGIAQQAYASAL